MSDFGKHYGLPWTMRFVWPRHGTGGVFLCQEDTGPMCEACAMQLWDDLGRYPLTREAVTISTVTG